MQASSSVPSSAVRPIVPTATPTDAGPDVHATDAGPSQAPNTDIEPALVSPMWQDPDALLRSTAQPALERIQRDRERVSPRLRPMLEHIGRHLFDPELNINRLKQACGIRDNSIAILFHSQIGQSPKAYLSQRRLETASRLLRDTEMRVWRIAEMVGYSSLGVFSKAFNRWAKQRPNAFRKQARQLAQGLPNSLLSTVEFMDRALSGALTDREADRLLQRLLELYPGLTDEAALRRLGDDAIPIAGDLASPPQL